MKNSLILLVLIFLCIGEIGEIKEQSLKYGEYIQQYAIINKIGIGGRYYEYCSDCSATITITFEGQNIIYNKTMNYLGNGLFGYIANPSELNVNKDYRAIVTSISPTYGTGITDSRFKIIENININPSVAVDNSNGGTPSSGTGGILSGITGDLGTTLFTGLADYIKLEFVKVKIFVILVVDALGIHELASLIFKFAIDIAKFTSLIFGGILWCLEVIKGLILEPSTTINEILWPLFLNIGLFFVLGYFLWVLFFEALAIGYAFIKNPQADVFTIIGTWWMFHVNVVYYLYLFVLMTIQAFSQMFLVGVKTLSFVRQIFQL